MSSKKTIKDVPDYEVDQIVEDFRSEGCLVKKVKQDNGKWTVIADCP